MADIVVETGFGKFFVDDQDCIGTTLKAGTLWDGPGFLQVIAREYGALGQPGVTIIDVGANVGSFSIWLAHQGAWRVIAVEPIPETLRYLRASLDLNQATCADKVVVLPVAAYAHGMRLQPHVVPHNHGAGEVRLLTDNEVSDALVEGRALDDFRWLFAGRVSLIKIDAQGCDGAALRGLRRTLEQHHPAIVFEWEAELAERHGYSLSGTTTWLEGMGYEVHPWPNQPNNYLAVWKGSE